MTREPFYAIINSLEEIAAYHYSRGDECKHLAKRFIQAQGNRDRLPALIDEALNVMMMYAATLAEREAQDAG